MCLTAHFHLPFGKVQTELLHSVYKQYCKTLKYTATCGTSCERFYMNLKTFQDGFKVFSIGNKKVNNHT